MSKAAMKILLSSSEVVPFAKTGGLADVAGTLPRVLSEMGHDVRLVMPLYRTRIDRKGLTRVGGALGVPMGPLGEHWCAVYVGRLPRSEVPVYFIDHEAYFGRAGIYNHANGSGFLDNDRRFVFLSRASLQLCTMLNWIPDVVHANDWHTAAIPVMLNTVYANTALGRIASLLTIHNMQYQGRFYPALMRVMEVGWEHFNFRELEFKGVVNLLKGGLYHATLVNTVSPGYAEEIKTPEFGYGLEGVARDRAGDLVGILNGIDYEEWDPSSDPHLPATYTVEDRSGKAVCKAELQKEMGLPVREDVPLLGLISRLVHQKGLDVFAAVAERLVGSMDVQFVLLGSGEPWAHAFFAALARRYPKRFAAHLGYDVGLSHRIEAGSDFFVMPSRFEPCGLNQLYSLRYGTPPIVHATGGLRDTVENLDEDTGEGTGFTFEWLTPSAVYNTIGWAVHTYYNRREMVETMRTRGMRQRFTWEQSAEQYVALYEEAVRRRHM